MITKDHTIYTKHTSDITDPTLISPTHYQDVVRVAGLHPTKIERKVAARIESNSQRFNKHAAVMVELVDHFSTITIITGLSSYTRLQESASR